MTQRKRLTLLVDDAWLEHAQIVALREKGYTILPLSVVAEKVDLVLSKHAHYWIDAMFDAGYLEMALKRARR